MNHLTIPEQFKDLIFISGDAAQTDSIRLSERFDKQHGHVLRDIELAKTHPDAEEGDFVESFYIDDYGRPQKMYLLSEEAFGVLAMGFTGKAAEDWKWKFVKAFKWCRKELYRLYQENVNLKAKQHITQVESTANLHILGKLNDAQPRTDYRIKQFERQAAKCLALAEKGQQMYDSCSCGQARLSRTGWRKLIKDDDVSKFLEFGNEVKSLFPDYPDFDPGIDDLI